VIRNLGDMELMLGFESDRRLLVCSIRGSVYCCFNKANSGEGMKTELLLEGDSCGV
jgi:hypothetical protein